MLSRRAVVGVHDNRIRQWRLSARIGKTNALTATVRKIAVLFFNTLRYGMDYVDLGAAYYEEHYRQRVLNNLTRRADSMGYVVQPTAGRCEGVSQEGPQK